MGARQCVFWFDVLAFAVVYVTRADDGIWNQSYLMCLAKCSLLVKLKLHGG